MTSAIQIHIQTHGDFAYDATAIPLEVVITDQKLQPVETRLTTARGTLNFPLPPGTYSVSVSTPSGSQVQSVVSLGSGETKEVALPLYEISPREDFEWAYLTQKTSRQAPLREQKLAGAWLRFWRSYRATNELEDLDYDSYETPNGRYLTIPQTPDNLTCVQVGGEYVPWKCVALPPGTSCKVLIEAQAHKGRHDLRVSVAGDNLTAESLLSYLQRGELDLAVEVERRQSTLAEELVFSKREDPVAAAIGGYYLLRVGDHQRLHSWANNLANWFTWMPDGAIIHGWQLIEQYRQGGGAEEAMLDLARDRLVEAVDRGYPIYTEGLRLLRDGLLLLDQHYEGQDESVQAAMEKNGRYFSAADLAAANTTFLGATPFEPSPRPVTGVPGDRSGLKWVFD